jgi:hypothetical protein
MLKELGFCRVKGFGIPDAPESEKAPAPPPVVWADVESTEKQRLFRYIESGGEDLSLTPLERTVPEMVQARREMYRTMIRRYEGTLTRHIETEVATEIVNGLTTLIEMAIVEKICGDGCSLSPARLRDFGHLPTQVHEGGQWIDKPGRSEHIARSISKECIVDGKPVRLDDALKLTEALKKSAASVVAPYVTVDELTAMAGPIDHARLATLSELGVALPPNPPSYHVSQQGEEIVVASTRSSDPRRLERPSDRSPRCWVVQTVDGRFVYRNRHNAYLDGFWVEPHQPSPRTRADAQAMCDHWNKVVSDKKSGLTLATDEGRLVELDSNGKIAEEQLWQGTPLSEIEISDDALVGLMVEFRRGAYGFVLRGHVIGKGPDGLVRVEVYSYGGSGNAVLGTYWVHRNSCIVQRG